ncbi:hypothetical protein D9758_002908 [Tetrapyrgos nigripes]|uniref:Uncharacterized protein n=1 Tax=Tetrapyrgos nigripes TaxID=182062 RepID=A0A8H5GQ96_9AGAR|nr:hypothetical protein D9758_002908 [Tetrapyrgos nigripes]
MNSSAISEYVPSSNVYIPIHKRRTSTEKFTCGLPSEDVILSSSWSSASSSPRSATFSVTESLAKSTRSPFVYTIEELLRLRKSPLVFVSPERREEIRRNVPDVYMNRRQRLAKAAKEGDAQHYAKHRQAKDTNDEDHCQSGRVTPTPSPLSQYSQKLKRRTQWREKNSQGNQTPRSALFTPEPVAKSHPLPQISVDGLAPHTEVSFMIPEVLSTITQLGYPQRRIRWSTEKRENSKVVDESDWREPRQRTWYTQSSVST